ncbi:MAG: uracil-xanthine permease family protein, partial [Granulosicoccus sp.]
GTELKIALFEVQKIARARLEALVQRRMPVIKPLAMPIDTMLHPADMAGAYQGRAETKKKRVRPVMTAEQMRDPNYKPGVARGLLLGIQHVLAMFVVNITPAILIAGVVGFGFGSENPANMTYMIQMSLFFAGIATLIQANGIGPVGARLPIVQGAGFVYLPIMIPIAVQYGMPTLMGAIVISGVFHFFLGLAIGRIRRWIPPLVTGLVVLMVGVELIRIGVLYSAGGEQLRGTPEFGSMDQWSLALLVIAVTLLLKFFARGVLSESAVLLGLLAGYLFAWWQGIVSLTGLQDSALFVMPNPLHFGFEFNLSAVVGMCLMAFVSVVATSGNISVLTQVGADREASDKELIGGSTASGLGNVVGGFFGALPGACFSQSIGLVFLTRLMSRHVVMFSALILILCGLMPVIGAGIQTIPVAVLGGALLIMLGMFLAASVNMLATVSWNKRNMLIFGIALSVGLGLQFEPDAIQNLPQTARVLMSSGLLPATLIAIVLNLLMPQADSDEPSKQMAGS